MVQLDQINGIILDMDGVLWREYRPLADLSTIFSWFNRRNWKSVCLTNNSTRSPDEYIKIMDDFGVKLEPWQVLSSSGAALEYLKSNFPSQESIYIVGESGLFRLLSEAGFITQLDDKFTNSPAAVVVGLDRELTYAKIAQAADYIRQGALFVGTNPDKSFPAETGLKPGAGTCVTAVATAAETEPLILGKPEPGIFQTALQRMKLEPEEVLMVGDRLETDILGAQQLGMKTALVLSGVTNQAQLSQWKPAPDFTANNISDLIKQMEH
jgi:4-nitrophenyl phosphatase